MIRLQIQGTFFQHFDKISISRTLDSVASSFSVVTRFNPDNAQHRSLFEPLRYKQVKLYADDMVLLTGNLVNHTFKASNKPELVQLSGYSKGGILEDVTIAHNQYPLESLNPT